MGVWGMSLRQSDEYCEVYEAFMSEYDCGAAVSDIRSQIIASYTEEFAEDDPILHDAFFAIAKAEWMCCEQSQELLNRVGEIIRSGKNLEYYRELGATESDLRQRKKNLDSFWASLQTPRAKPRKRRPHPADRVLPIPSLNPGDVFSYRGKAGQRVAVVLDRYRYFGMREVLFCCILKRDFTMKAIRETDVLQEEIGCIGVYFGEDFPSADSITVQGSVVVPEDFHSTFLWKYEIFGSKQDFRADCKDAPPMKLCELLQQRLAGKAILRSYFRGNLSWTN